MIYHISNPSDAYTMESDNFHIAAVAVAILGGGHYGIQAIDGSESTPTLFGWDEWLKEHEIDMGKFIPEHEEEIAAVLDSVLIGGPSERETVKEALALISENDREKWLESRHERMRSSMNNIGAKAKRLSAILKENATKRKAAA